MIKLQHKTRLIQISRNRVNSIERASFVNLRKLRTLRLSHNFIESFPSNAIQETPVLYSLDLSNNKLEFVSGIYLYGAHKLNCTFLGDLFNRAKMLQELNLAGNKIDCCLMSDYFTRLVNERFVRVIDTLSNDLFRQTECGQPIRNVGLTVDQVSIPCPTTTTTTTTSTTTTSTTSTSTTTTTTTRIEVVPNEATTVETIATTMAVYIGSMWNDPDMALFAYLSLPLYTLFLV